MGWNGKKARKEKENHREINEWNRRIKKEWQKLRKKLKWKNNSLEWNINWKEELARNKRNGESTKIQKSEI